MSLAKSFLILFCGIALNATPGMADNAVATPGNNKSVETLASKEAKLKDLEKKFDMEAFRKSASTAGVTDLTVPNAQISWNYVDTLLMLGWDYDRAKTFDKGRSCFQKNYELYKTAFGEERSDTIQALNQLAMHYVREGKYAEAESTAKKCVELQKKILGQNNPQLIFSLNTLFHVYQDQDRDAEADSICKQQLQIAEASTGKNSVMVANLLEADAEVLNHMGKTAEANAAKQRAEVIRVKTKSHSEHRVDGQILKK